LEAVESEVRGQQRSEELAVSAGEIATDGARALNYNNFKIPLMQNLVKRAIRG
jgi:CO/xanthine dehydrogenase FAD-binding subunit